MITKTRPAWSGPDHWVSSGPGRTPTHPSNNLTNDSRNQFSHGITYNGAATHDHGNKSPLFFAKIPSFCHKTLLFPFPNTLFFMAILKRLRISPKTTSFVASCSSFSSCNIPSSRIDLSNHDIRSTSDPGTLPSFRREAGGGGPRIGRNNYQWVFLGCPGVGKGTYASRLSRLIGVPHISTGDLLRDELGSSGSTSSRLSDIVNQGKLVPDEVIIDLLSKRLAAGQLKGETGFILDGFPRTVRQAEILEGVTDIDLVVNLKLREEALLAKCLGRRICSECGGNFNIACLDIKPENGQPGMYMAPLLPPPQCASKLITRSDDTEEVVKERLRVYNEMTKPVEEFYRRRGKLLEFDLPGGIPESWPKLLKALNLQDHDGHHDGHHNGQRSVAA